MNTQTSESLPIRPLKKDVLTHKQLVRRMGLWLKNNQNYGVVVAEFISRIDEIPDLLGFKGADSLLIECKVTRSDFLADKAKLFRARPEEGLGDLRYFAAPEGVIKPDDLPENSGLLQVTDRQVRRIVEATVQPANKSKEVSLLVSAMRRLEISTAVFVRAEEPELETASS
jgi:hypothetical protein